MTGEAFMPNKVLIVDDEPFNLDLLEQELGDQGYIIETARDGEEAIVKVFIRFDGPAPGIRVRGPGRFQWRGGDKESRAGETRSDRNGSQNAGFGWVGSHPEDQSE